MTTIGKPKIDRRPRQVYMGIRTIAPFKGMSKVIKRLSQKMNVWVDEHNVKPAGQPFLRYHVIDMRGAMDISFGFPVHKALSDDGAVKADVLPAGRYASLVYSGGGISGNRALIEWVRAQGLEFDRWDTEQGDHFSAATKRISPTRMSNPASQNGESKWRSNWRKNN